MTSEEQRSSDCEEPLSRKERILRELAKLQRAGISLPPEDQPSAVELARQEKRERLAQEEND